MLPSNNYSTSFSLHLHCHHPSLSHPHLSLGGFNRLLPSFAFSPLKHKPDLLKTQTWLYLLKISRNAFRINPMSLVCLQGCQWPGPAHPFTFNSYHFAPHSYGFCQTGPFSVSLIHNSPSSFGASTHAVLIAPDMNLFPYIYLQLHLAKSSPS